jgi:hypothetical protein
MRQLIIHQGPRAGDQHPVDSEVILGRERGSADLVIEDPGVSRRHARLIPEGGALVVEDLGSSNGTYVNGERISGPVQIDERDRVQLGGTVVGLTGAPATAPMRAPAPRRLAPALDEPGNLPALAAVFLGPLSILLVFLSIGGFFVALPCGIAAIALGTVGIRNAARGRGHRVPARIGRFTGILGTVLATLALIVFVVVAAALDTTASSVGGLIDAIREEIDKVEVPGVTPPDVNAPDVNTQEAPR